VIGTLLERAARRTQAADLTSKTDETLTLGFEGGRLKSAGRLQERGVNLRVVAGGRMGFAGTTDTEPEPLLEMALASAAVGQEVKLELPRPQPLPQVATHYPRAAVATLEELTRLGRGIHDRLARDGCHVRVTVERSVGSVRVANTAGVDAGYDVSSVSLGAELVRIRGDDVLTIREYWAGGDLPGNADLERLAGGILQRLEWAERTAESPHGALTVCFTPTGAEALLLPLHAALQGKALLHGVSPLMVRGRAITFASSFSLTDDPLLDGRPGSRPIDDEGVVSRRTSLVHQGNVQEFIYDLESAGRAGTQPTGHGRRTIFGKPQAAFSNLVVTPGEYSLPNLLGLISSGVLVDRLHGVGQGNLVSGTFAHQIATAYRVENGEVVGRIASGTVAGNAYELLGRITTLGRDAPWRGSTSVPAMLVEGVTVS
jgi:PmbA protein